MKHRFSHSQGLRSESNTKYKYPIAILKASVIGLVFTVIILLAMAIVMSIQDIPYMLINPIASLAVAAGAFLAGFLVSKSCREKGLLLGSACGMVIYLAMLAANTFVGSGFGLEALFKLIIALTSGALGGVIGVNARVKRR